MRDRPAVVDQRDYTTWDGGPTFNVRYSPAEKALQYTVKVQKNTYLALHYGISISDLDGVLMQNGGTKPTITMKDTIWNRDKGGEKGPVADAPKYKNKQSLSNIKISDLDKDGWATYEFSKEIMPEDKTDY